MMDRKLVDLACQVIKLNSWIWVPGMLGVRLAPEGSVDYLRPEIRIAGMRDVEIAKGFGSIPDLTDLPTLGAILGLVQVACKDDKVYLCHYDGYDSVEWGVCSNVIEKIREVHDLAPRGWMTILVADASTEGAALALSLMEAERIYAKIHNQYKEIE